MIEVSEREILMNIREAAMYLSLSERTISRWIASGKIEAYRYSEKIVRISVKELDKVKKPALKKSDTKVISGTNYDRLSKKISSARKIQS